MSARAFLAGHFPTTRMVHSAALSGETGAAVFLKLEAELPTGSFKVRGAMYSLSMHLRRRAVAEVVASSTGNHGAAVAWAARTLGLSATVFLPRDPSPVKRALIESFGARTVEEGRGLAEATEAARLHAEQHGALFLHDADDPWVPEGAGTIAFEIVEQVPAVDVIYVPVGDSALIRGVSAALKAVRPHTTVAGVQAASAPAYYLSWKAGSVVTTDDCDTIAEGLATRAPLAANVAAICDLVDSMHLVTDAEMVEAMACLDAEGVRAEPAGAAGVAAVRKQRDSIRGKTVVALVTGANRRE
ncbi:MAG TPA: pyridoxal-phosphate dependent enzyme [Thermoanaerobaculia bacterium]|nr:pyridoxal-phosphate dependent enzyme [Thermoanaerobaculia bacterium]